MPTSTPIPTATVAVRLGLDRRKVVRMVQSGELKPVQKLPGETGAYLFDPADVDALAAQRRAS